MRILLIAFHRYPASGANGSGPHPRELPSGSGYHLHDLLAQGLAEAGHEVFYCLKKGSDVALPRGVNEVSSLLSDVDICHAPIGPPGQAEEVMEFGARHRKPCLLTCHMWTESNVAESNWVFVSRSLAHAHGSERVVLNGLHPDDYIFSGTKQDYLLFMGSMDKAIAKGLDLALAVAAEKGIRLIVAGTARSYEVIRHVSELCAAAGAEYVGDVRGVRKAELMAGARALLFPSRLNEGCPLVIIEAMLSGTPVISSACGGSVELVTPETGMLCRRDEEWGPAVDRLGEISPIRCREIGLERYDYRRMVKDYLREYDWEIAHFNG